MCGIYGYVGIDENKAPILARTLCALNQSRGHHSAGIATVDEQCRTNIAKSAVAPTRFILSKKFNSLVNSPHRVLIGHTRYATHGDITKVNAHPFRFGSTVGAHNGVVANLTGVAKYTCRDYDVDSMHLIDMLDRFGHLGPARGSLNVAYCGAKDAADLRLIRYGNPLHYAVVDDERGFVFSSDENDLLVALRVAGYSDQVEVFPSDCSAAVYLHQDGIELTFGTVPFGKPEEMKPFMLDTTAAKSWKDYVSPWHNSLAKYGKPSIQDELALTEAEMDGGKPIYRMTDEEFEAWEAYESRDDS